MKKKGKFIVIEGIGGCGKDTQVVLLGKYLDKLKKDFLITREHTRDTPPGALIERIIKKKEDQIEALALQLLYVCDRRNHFINVIKSALDKGKIVVGNRYYPTTVAYTPQKWKKVVLKLNQSIVDRPDLVIVIDTDPEVAVSRVDGRGDADIFDWAESLKRCRKGYQWYAKNSGDKVVFIDGNGTKTEVFEKILREIKKRKII
jgi:dTMP kinase